MYRYTNEPPPTPDTPICPPPEPVTDDLISVLEEIENHFPPGDDEDTR
jgi:hypothetical protein